MAVVYLAIQENFEREVALKIMSSTLSEDRNFSERFLREARIVSRLVHPHIVTVHDVAIENGHHYLSMEYINGQDLKQDLPGMTGDQIFRLMREVATALDYAGRKGYVHRDVKPENIMINADDGRAVLMDFGIARAADSNSTMTRTGTALGTPHYMSPEQARGDAIDGRSDLYSLGVLFYYMLTGKVPYEADSAVAVGIKHLTAPIPPLPKPLASYQPLINCLMAKKPGDRYQTGYDLIAAMEHFDPAPLNQWRLQKKIKYLTSQEYTPVRSDQMTVVSSSNVSAQRGGNSTKKVASVKKRRSVTRAGAMTTMLESVTDPKQDFKLRTQPRETITIPQEDLREHLSQAEKKTSPVFAYLLFAVGLCVVGAYFFRGEIYKTTAYQELANVLGIPLPEQPSLTQNSTTSLSLMDSLLGGKDGGAPLSEQEQAIADKSFISRIANAINFTSGIGFSGDPNVDRLITRSRALAEQVKEQPERTAELVALYQQILSFQRDQPQIIAAIEAMQSDLLSAAVVQIDAGELDSAQDTLSNAVLWFPELEQDERYLEIERRLVVTEQLNELLPLAEEYLASDRLIHPEEGNAKDTFAKILTFDPGNSIAQRGMQRILEHYVELVTQAESRRDYQKVLTLIEDGLSIDASYKPLLGLKTRAAANSARDQKIASLLMQAQVMEAEQKLFGEGQNAATYYQAVLAIDPQQIDAKLSLEQIRKGLFAQVDALVNGKDYENAIKLIEDALISLPDDRRLVLKLRELNTTKPAIDNVALSGQPIVDPNAGVPETINADRTLHVAFHYKGLDQDATVLQALLFDGARSVQIAAVPVMVLGGRGSTQFRVDRPVEGFTDGGYHLDILLAGKRIFTNSFVIAQ